MTVAIVDPDMFFQCVLRDLVLLQFPGSNLEYFNPGQNVVDWCGSRKVDLVIFSASYFDDHLTYLTQAIKKNSPTTKCFAVLKSIDRHSIYTLRNAGLAGVCLTRLYRPVDIAAYLARVVNGEQAYCSVVSTMLKSSRMKSYRHEQFLSKRELEVLGEIGTGANDAEIAVVLSIAENTARNHRASIMRKLDIHSSSRLMRYALRAGVARTGPFGGIYSAKLKPRRDITWEENLQILLLLGSTNRVKALLAANPLQAERILEWS